MKTLTNYLNSPASELEKLGYIEDSKEIVALYKLRVNEDQSLEDRFLFIEINKLKNNIQLSDLTGNIFNEDFDKLYKNLETLAEGKGINFIKNKIEYSHQNLQFIFIIKNLFKKFNTKIIF